jgi:hypothetical protein
VRWEIDQFFGVSGGRNHWRIAHKPRTYRLQSLTYRARQRIRTNAVQYSTNIRRMNYWRSASKHARFANVPRFVSDCQWNERDTCAVHAWYERWASVDVCGFEQVPTHKHWRPTRVPRIVTHTRRINYARRLMNYAHRSTVVRRKNFEPFKTQNHAQAAFDAHPLTITDSPRSFHRWITHTTHAPRRNEKLCVIRALFMRFRCVTGPLAHDPRPV